MVSFEFFSCCVVSVSDVDVPRVIAVAEDFAEGDGVSAGGSAQRRRDTVRREPNDASGASQLRSIGEWRCDRM